MRDVDTFVIHCSATPPHMDIGLEEIAQWHLERGWRACGYHFVIRRDGTLEEGRPVDSVGAHAKGHNLRSVGICLVGGTTDGGFPASNYTRAQWRTLDRLVAGLHFTFPGSKVVGHCDLEGVDKDCPCFDARSW